MAMATTRRLLLSYRSSSPISTTPTSFIQSFPRFFSRSPRYVVKVGIPEFLKGVGKGVETHAAALEAEFGDFGKLLEARRFMLKKLKIPCKHRKLILGYANQYRLGLWRPRADLVNVKPAKA